MICAGLEWRTAEPSATGSPNYVATDYNGVYAEIRHNGHNWKWMVYGAIGEDADLPSDSGYEPNFQRATRAIVESIGQGR